MRDSSIDTQTLNANDPTYASHLVAYDPTLRPPADKIDQVNILQGRRKKQATSFYRE